MDELEKLLKDSPFILDKDFQGKFPRIIDVAIFLSAASTASCKKTGRYELFDNLGIGSVGDYLEILQQGDEEAIKSYRNLRRIIEGGETENRSCMAS